MLFKRVLLNDVVFFSAVSSGLAAPISIDTVATVKNLLAGLSSQSGEFHEALPQIEGEVLLLRAKDQEPAEIRTRIATILRSKWTQTEKGWRLVPDEDLWKALRSARTKEIASVIQRGFADQEKDTPAKLTVADLRELDVAQDAASANRRTKGSWAQTFSFLNGRAPGNRAAFRILKLIGAMELAGMRPETRKVFSSEPTRMQQALPAAALTVANKALDEYALYESVIPRKDDSANFGMFGSDGGFVASNYLTAQGPVANVQIALYRGSQQLNFFAHLVAYNRAGKEVYRATYNCAFDSLVPNASKEIARQRTGWTPGEANARATFTEEGLLSKEIFDPNKVGGAGIDMMMSGGGPPPYPWRKASITMSSSLKSAAVPVTEDQRGKFSSPETIDPLGFHVKEALLLATPSSSNVIALVPDSLTHEVSKSVLEDARVGEIKEELGFAGMIRREENGWWTWEPSDIPGSKDVRLSRAALARALAEVAGNTIWTLDQQTTYVSQRPRGLRGSFDLALLGSLFPLANAVTLPDGDILGHMRLWGSLSPELRRQLREGRPVTYGSLNATQKAIYNDIIFNGPGGPVDKTAPYQPGMVLEGRDRGIERTVALGGGIPPDASIAAVMEVEPGALAKFESGAIRLYSARSLYSSLSIVEEFPNWFATSSTMSQFAEVDIVNILLSLNLRPNYSSTPVGKWLFGINTTKKLSFGSLGDMSAKFKTLYEGARADDEKAKADRKKSGRG